jgi:peptidoglycan/xylan/chitin deacetylase (PgdA/CDA1 family)
MTPAVLKALKDNDVRAMFFLVGHRAEKYPHIVGEIVKGGHKIGNHSYAHYNDRVPGYSEYRGDILKCQEVIRNITGDEPRYFRPPRGIISLPSLLAARSVGLQNIFWSLEGGEWGRNRHAGIDFIIQSIIHDAKNRYILLLHDDHAYVADILDVILPALRQKNIDLNGGIDCI